MPTHFLSRPGALCLAATIALVAGLAPSLPAQYANAPLAVNNEVVEITTPKSVVLIVEEFTKVLKTRTRITQVDGFDQGIVDVTALSPTELQVRGIAPGVTRIVITDERAQRYEVDARVVSHLQAHLSRLFPDGSIEVVHISPESIILRGWVTQPDHVVEVVDIAGQFYAPANVLNQLRVGGAQQVQLNVKVLEVQRAKLRRLGINFSYMDETIAFASAPGFVGGVETIAAAIVDDDTSFELLVEALREERLLKIMSEPKMVTTNGRPANMLAGGEFAVPQAQGLGTVTVQWREFGVRMEAVPYILGNGRLRLELMPEVSEPDFTNAFDINGFRVPGLTTRRVNTQVEMRFGQTLMLAGLLSVRDTAQTQKIPFFGELPWIGAVFRRVRYDESETELIIMVTPELVAPLEPHQVPPLGPGQFSDVPTDRELFHYGLLEVPNYGPHCPTCLPGGPAPIPVPPQPGQPGSIVMPPQQHLIPPAPPAPMGPPMGPPALAPMAPGVSDELPSPSVLELEQALDGAAASRGQPARWLKTADARRPAGSGTTRQTSYTGTAAAPNTSGTPHRQPAAGQGAGRARLTPAGSVEPQAGLLQPR
jgi:pilus assembly protein CpaC